jgi:hypothetical protein
LLGYGIMYYSPQVSANILSFFSMAKKFKSLFYDNNKKDAFVVTRDDGTTFEFITSKDRLYYYDFTNSIRRKKEFDAARVMIINTVDEIKKNFSKREIENADRAQRM